MPEDTPGERTVRRASVYLKLMLAIKELRAWVHAIGDSEAWCGSMGDDGQGHDEGSILACEMLMRFDKALADWEGGHLSPPAPPGSY